MVIIKQETVEIYGFKFTPGIHIEVVPEGDNQFIFKFDWGKTRRKTRFPNQQSKKMFSDFINKMWKESANFNKESEMFFTRDETGYGWNYSYRRDSKDTVICKMTYNKLYDGKQVKGENSSKQGPDMWDCYKFLIEKRNIPIPKNLNFNEVMGISKPYYLYCDFKKGKPHKFQINIKNGGCVEETDLDVEKSLKVLLYYIDGVSIYKLSVLEEMEVKDIENIVLAYNNGKLGYFLRKQIEMNTEYYDLSKYLI